MAKLEEIHSTVFVHIQLLGVEIFLEEIVILVTREMKIKFSKVDQGSSRHHLGIIRLA